MKPFKQVVLPIVALAFSLLCASAQAAQPPIEITSEVHELIEVMDDQGKPQQKVIAADEITPGDQILFTTRFKNNGDESSDNVVITNPIPKHTRYLAGSAKGENCIITFSVDGGRAWGDATALKVRLKDGSFRAATATDYTHIRWKYAKVLQPAEQKSISFQTKLL